MNRFITNPTTRHNFIVNILDGSFFGFALGFGSFVTVIPLFVSKLTDSAILIGLIPAIHSVGWQLPQLLTVNWISRSSRFKPYVIRTTIHERLPYFFLGLIAFFLPRLDVRIALTLTYIVLIWQGLGGGLTATAWQSMINKVIPPRRHGIFFGTQGSAANLLAAVSAVFAGLILEQITGKNGFSINFFLAGFWMMISLYFLSRTREEARNIKDVDTHLSGRDLTAILRQDPHFRLFVGIRNMIQISIMAVGFYSVYTLQKFGLSEGKIGLMTAVYSSSQIITNPLLGYIGDRYGHRSALFIGTISAAGSGFVAWLSPDANWFYLAFALAGIANVAAWTIAIAMTLEFGRDDQKPAYIGLSNTLTAPSTLLAPVLGGLLADYAGYQATFLLSGIASVVTMLLILQIPEESHR